MNERGADYSSSIDRSVVPIEIISRQYLCQSWAPFIGSALTSSPHLEQRTPFLLISTPPARVIKRTQVERDRETQRRVARISNFEVRTPLYFRDAFIHRRNWNNWNNNNSARDSSLFTLVSFPSLLSRTLGNSLVLALWSRQSQDGSERAQSSLSIGHSSNRRGFSLFLGVRTTERVHMKCSRFFGNNVEWQRGTGGLVPKNDECGCL